MNDGSLLMYIGTAIKVVNTENINCTINILLRESLFSEKIIAPEKIAPIIE